MWTYICQRDPRWAQVRIGESHATLGRSGCTCSCLSMLSSFFDCFQTPDQIASHNGWFNTLGEVLWNKLQFARMVFTNRQYGRNDIMIKAAIKGPNTAVMLQVAHGSHWVVALRPTLLGRSYIVADPWLGDSCDVIKRYGNITGAAYFRSAKPL